MASPILRAPGLRADQYCSASSAILQRWRRQIACRTELADRRGVRPFVLVGYRLDGTPEGTLVPLERLTFLVLFDEWDEDDRLATRLLGFRGRTMHDLIQVGGPELTRFEKDLRLPPCSGNGRRLDPHDAALCEAALSWEKYLERVNRHPHYPRRNILRWPTWWCSAAELPKHLPTRCLRGETLISVEAAAANGLPIRQVFVDVAGVPKRQVLAGDDPCRLLCGESGMVSFDLYHSKFRRAT